MPLEKVRKTLKVAKEPLSLETPTGDEGDSHLGDLIEDTNCTKEPRHAPVTRRGFPGKQGAISGLRQCLFDRWFV